MQDKEMPGKRGEAEVPDDVKQFLRSILMSKSGVKQSKIERDYRELVGESLPWRKLGFKNLFEFLMSVPDVAKLEFRKKDEENRVFAVLDKDCFNSVHAKRMAEKGFGQGSKPLSPSEIAKWKASKNQKTAQETIHHSSSAPSILKTANNEISCQLAHIPIPAAFSDNQNIPKRQENKQHKQITDNQKTSISNNDDELMPNLEGIYSLCVKISVVDKDQPIPPQNILQEVIKVHFSKPRCKIFKINILPSRAMVFVRYKSKSEAAYAMVMTHNTNYMGLHFTVKPANEKTKHSDIINDSFTQASASSLLPTSNISLMGNQPCNLSVANHIKEQTCNHTLSSIENLLQKGQLLLPSPPRNLSIQRDLQQNSSHSVNMPQTSLPHLNTKPVNLSPVTLEMANTPNSSVKPDSLQISNLQTVSTQDKAKHSKDINGTIDFNLQHTETIAKVKNEALDRDTDDAMKDEQTECSRDNCWLDHSTIIRLFQMSCRRKPKCANDFPEKIQFIITFALDACRFWIQRSDFEESCRKLNEKLRNELENSSPRANVFPNKNHFGAAKFHEDGMWYRCWVLDSNRSKNEIRVYFCDYGNTEVISGENFLHVNKTYWVLPPQGIQAMLHGFEQKQDLDEGVFKKGADFLNEICTGKLIEAEVVKQQNTSQPHIIELKNLSVPGLENGFLEDALTKNGIIAKKETSMVQEKSDVRMAPTSRVPAVPVNSSKLCPSLFGYRPENLRKVQVLAVESPNLFHIKTHDSDERLEEIKRLLASFVPEEKAEMTIGSKVCLKDESGNFRVNIMDLSCNFMYSKKVLVFNPDSGEKIWANVDDLYVLSQELKDIPETAISAALAGIETKNRVTNATSLLRERIGKDSFIHIIGESSSGQLHVELFIDDTSCSINLDVVHRGLAKVIRKGPFGLPKDFRTPPHRTKNTSTSGSRTSSFSSTGHMSPRSQTSSTVPVSPNPFGAGTIFGENCNVEFNTPQSHKENRPLNKTPPKKDHMTGKPPNLYDGQKQINVIDITSDGNTSDGSSSVGWLSENENKKNINIDYLDCQGDYGSCSSLTDVDKDGGKSIPSNIHEKELSKQKHCEIKSTDTRPKFRPRTPPFLPDLIEIEAPVKELKLSKTLLSLMNAAAKDAGLNDFIKFKDDGSLDREAVNVEMQCWDSNRELLERYQKTLNELLALPDDKTNTQLIKNRRKRLALLVKTSEAEKQLAELTAELNELKYQLIS